MAKYRVWTGDDLEADDNEILKNTSSLAEAIKYIRKNTDLDEYNSGLQVLEDAWDEWLDEDDQNIHEHLYMYGGKSCYLQDLEEEEDDEDDDLDDDDEDDEEVEEVEEEDDVVDEDIDERLMDVIGGGKTPSQVAEEEDEIIDVEEEFDDDDDFEEDLEEEENEKEI